MGFLDWLRPARAPSTPPPAPPARDPLALLAAHRRRAWVPVVEKGDGAADDSKLSGTPWLRPGESWPACGNCGRPMQLFVQIHARDLPAGAADPLGGRLLQFFYCTSEEPLCEVECEAFFPGARSTLLRLADARGSAAPPATRPPGEFPPLRLVGWEEVDDYPGHDEDVGVELTDAEWDAFYALDYPRPGDKWGGWPAWIQAAEYPACPECGREMALLFQVDSQCNRPFMFGDLGTGHITQCPDHPERLAFGWACT
jgi:hypothetical protein